MGNAAKILSGPAGYALVIIVAGVVIYELFNQVKKPISDAYAGLQNFDQNVGLGGFDAWVSGLFSAPVQTP